MLLWIVLIVIAVLLCLFLSMKVGARIVFGSELKAWIKIGPAILQVYPTKEPKKEKTRKEKKATGKDIAEKPKRNITFDAVWQMVNELIPPVLDTLERVRKGLHIRTLNLSLTISDCNPAVAAQRYGKINAIIWPLLAAIENVVTVERRDVRLNLDFASHSTSAEGELFITMRVHHGVRILLADGVKLLKPVIKFVKRIKPEQDRKTTDQPNSKDTAAA